MTSAGGGRVFMLKYSRYQCNQLQQHQWSMCPNFGAISEPFLQKVRIRTKSPIFGVGGSSASHYYANNLCIFLPMFRVACRHSPHSCRQLRSPSVPKTRVDPAQGPSTSQQALQEIIQSEIQSQDVDMLDLTIN